MNRLGRFFASVLGALLVLGLFASQGPAAPAEERIHIYVGAPGRNKVPLALPLPNGPDHPAKTAFYETLVRDLTLTGWFDILDPNVSIEPVGTGIKPGDFKFEDWDVLGAVALAKTSLQLRGGDRGRIEVWTYDVGGRRKLGAKAFSGDLDSVRSLAHRTAGEIIFLVTGQTAPFNTRFAAAANFTGNKEIYLVDFDGSSLMPLTKNGSINLQPAWHPEGLAVTFTSYVAGNPDLYLADLVKGKIRRISARTGINTGGSWNPLGNLLALTLSYKGDPDIFTIDPTTGKQVSRLTQSPGIDTSPAWSPDGKQIAFVSERSGGPQIYVMNADGSNAHRISFKGRHNTDPTWSPDGKTLAFVGRDGNFDIFTVHADGSNTRRVTQGEGDNEDPTWSPDGNYLAFSSTRSGSPHIWMSSADGSHQVQLTQGKGGYTNPAWSPLLDW